MQTIQRQLATIILAALVIGALLTLTIAWGSSGQPEATGSPSPAATPPPAPIRSISTTGSVTVQLTDQGFIPNYVESTNGHALTITLVNTGTRLHSFRIDYYAIAIELPPGATHTLTIPSPDLGDFTYLSNSPGDTGMHGTLTFYI